MDGLKDIVLELGASSGAIMVVDESAQLLRCGSSYNMPPEWTEITNPFDLTTINGKVYIEGKSMMINNMNEELAGHHVGSVLIVPVKRAGKVIGTIELIANGTNTSFDKSAQERLEEVAERISSDL